MDRSYLSDKDVVNASRGFICLRLVTYEDAQEMEFMKSTYFFQTPTKNSLFAILDPAGKKHLVSPGRSMRNTFEDADAMAQRMDEILKDYPKPKQGDLGKLGLPYLKDVRVALNVAACDSQRLVILYAKTDAECRKLEGMLQPLAWDKSLVGNLLYATTNEVKDLEQIDDVGRSAGLLIIEPGPYGVRGRQVGFIDVSTKPASALRSLIKVAKANQLGSKDSKVHIGLGMREGIEWKPAFEDTDTARTKRRPR
ncbi:MAG: hypothetical protein ACI9F9_001613 [Candidatus Paceibacteria bacterium]|jgi:hypothetical protein